MMHQLKEKQTHPLYSDTKIIILSQTKFMDYTCETSL